MNFDECPDCGSKRVTEYGRHVACQNCWRPIDKRHCSRRMLERAGVR